MTYLLKMLEGYFNEKKKLKNFYIQKIIMHIFVTQENLTVINTVYRMFPYLS